MANPELFENTFYAWLEANGLTFLDDFDARPEPPFHCTIDLNKLKAGVGELIEVSKRAAAAHNPSPRDGTIREQHGEPAIPGRIEHHDYPLTAECEHCGGQITKTRRLTGWKHREEAQTDDKQQEAGSTIPPPRAGRHRADRHH